MEMDFETFMDLLILGARSGIEEKIKNGDLKFGDEEVTAYFGSFSGMIPNFSFLAFIIENCDLGVELTPEEIVKFKVLLDIFEKECKKGKELISRE